MEILSERLKWLREKNRFNQKEVAEKVELSVSGYQKIEYGEANPKIDTLIKLANLYGESTDFLLGLTDHTKELLHSSYSVHFISEQLEEAKREFSNVYFNESIDEDVKKDLEKKVLYYQNRFQEKFEDYIHQFLQVPYAKRESDPFLSDRLPIYISYEFNEILNEWVVNLYDKKDEPLIQLDICKKEKSAQLQSIIFSHMYKVQVDMK